MPDLQFQLGSIKRPLGQICAERVQALLSVEHPRLRVHTRYFAPGADGSANSAPLTTALLAHEIDAAVLPYADLPADLSPKLTISAVPPRARTHHVFYGTTGVGYGDLPAGSVVMSYGVGRIAQLRRQRADIEIIEVDSLELLLERLSEGATCAVMEDVLSAAQSRQFDFIEELLTNDYIPLPGQGACAVVTRSPAAHDLVSVLHDPVTHWQVSAEEAFANSFSDARQLPLAAFATVEDGLLSLRARILSCEGDGVIEVSGSAQFRVDTPLEYAEVLGLQVAKLAADRGADDLMRDHPPI